MSRRRTVWDPNHPVNMLHAHGQRTKEGVRKLSNKEIDEFISANMKEPDRLAEILAWPRHRKIQFIKHCSMSSFANTLNKAQQEAAKGMEQ